MRISDVKRIFIRFPAESITDPAGNEIEEMEPGRFELPSQNAQNTASTCIVTC